MLARIDARATRGHRVVMVTRRQIEPDVFDHMVGYLVDTPDGPVGVLDGWNRDDDGRPETVIVVQGWFGRRQFEIVQRRGYQGFGAVNAPIRLAAQTRLAPHPAVPRH